jgi:hypothetical protein
LLFTFPSIFPSLAPYPSSPPPLVYILSFLMHLTARPTLLVHLDKQNHSQTNSACISDKTPPLWSPFNCHKLPIHWCTFVDEFHHRHALVL